MATLLADPYYSESHEVFRMATNQTQMMLDRLVDEVRTYRRLSILSVGSGAGLFEIPMLTRLGDEGMAVERFVGVDPSEHACAVLEQKLIEAELDGLDFELVTASFETFETTARFDLVVFNHVFEYLSGDAIAWVGKSRRLLDHGGKTLLFSPARGGINRIYEEAYAEVTGSPPLFADDIEPILDRSDTPFAVDLITAECEVSVLERTGDDPKKLMLLSFLTQLDCRDLPVETRDRYVAYYLSLREPGASSIAHPATLFTM